MWVHRNIGKKVESMEDHKHDNLNHWITKNNGNWNEHNSSKSEGNGVEFGKFISE